jgi:hypothetical protein
MVGERTHRHRSNALAAAAIVALLPLADAFLPVGPGLGGSAVGLRGSRAGAAPIRRAGVLGGRMSTDVKNDKNTDLENALFKKECDNVCAPNEVRECQ